MVKPHTMNFTLTEDFVDSFGRLKPSAILYFAQEAAGEHCKLLGADDREMDHLFWAVLRYRVEIARLPQKGENVTVKTWPMPTTRVAYPRATEILDETGQVVIRIISVWILMDTETRAMVLPGRSGVTVEGITLGSELPVPTTLPARETEEEMHRTVGIEDLDKNEHMNNTRYLAWTYDLLGESFLRENRLKAFTVCYLSEARLGQEIDLKWTVSPQGEVFVDSLRMGTEKPERVFAVKMEFDSIM